jgi:hypothetical protein
MLPSLFSQSLLETLTLFPPGTLRLEIGIQTFNPKVSARICRPSKPGKELETLQFLCEKTNAIIHADLICGLPGEDLTSFGKGFDTLWNVFYSAGKQSLERTEIQLGILKLLPGAPIARHNDTFAMRYAAAPPYEVLGTSTMSAPDLQRIKNFARFWEVLVNRYNIFSDNTLSNTAGTVFSGSSEIFNNFLDLSDYLYAKFGQNWGIDKDKLLKEVELFCPII